MSGTKLAQTLKKPKPTADRKRGPRPEPTVLSREVRRLGHAWDGPCPSGLVPSLVNSGRGFGH